MSSDKRSLRLFLIVLMVAGIGGPAGAAPPLNAPQTYRRGYPQRGPSGAMVSSQQKTGANGRVNVAATFVDGRRKLLSARAAWLKALVEAQVRAARATVEAERAEAEAEQSSEQAADESPDGESPDGESPDGEAPDGTTPVDELLNTLPTFAMPFTIVKGKGRRSDSREQPAPGYEAICGQLLALQQAAEDSPSGRAQGKIQWPEVLLGAEFCGWRMQLESLLAQREAVSGIAKYGVSRQVRVVAAQMREQLQWKIALITPAEYLAARLFLESLGYEGSLPGAVKGTSRK